MIPQMVELLESMKERKPRETDEAWKERTAPAAPVLSVFECQKAMDRAAAALEMPRLTHHDLRDIFATQCIEAGVPIPTVAKWLGHKDGGALLMRTYSHLRDDHSAEMAKRVTFGKATPADNIVQMELVV